MTTLLTMNVPPGIVVEGRFLTVQEEIGMNLRTAMARRLVTGSLILTAVLGASAQAQPVNPCGPKNPCAVQGGETRELDSRRITRPAGTVLATGDHTQLVKEGERLWKDAKLSKNGLSCDGCHANYGNFMPSFAKPYPHEVAMMRDKAGVQQIRLDEMVQGCLIVPMATQPLPWDSRELAALTTYTAEMQKGFKPGDTAPANPCAPKNPCGGQR